MVTQSKTYYKTPLPDGTAMEKTQEFVGNILSFYIHLGNLLTAVTVPITILFVILLVIHKIVEVAEHVAM